LREKKVQYSLVIIFVKEEKKRIFSRTNFCCIIEKNRCI
jgi:hypothetical protein